MTGPAGVGGAPHLPPSLADRAHTELQRLIVTCEAAPGSLLSERELARSTGYGLNPLRRALSRLHHDGLVVTVPRHGYLVAPLTAELVAETMDAWSVVGPEIVRRGLARLGDEDRERLRGLVGEWRVPDGGDGPRTLDEVAAFSARSQETFGMLAAACGNRWLLDVFLRVCAHVARTWIHVLTRAEGPDLARLAEDWNAAVGARDLTVLEDALPDLIVASGRIAGSWFTEHRAPGADT